MKVLVLGDGLLGGEIARQMPDWDVQSRKLTGFDIKRSWYLDCDIVVNCIGCTKTYTTNRDEHWNLNYVFVNKLIKYCNEYNLKLVHISTDYIYTGSDDEASETDVPVHCKNWYGYTKLLGDGLVQLLSNDYLLIRCSHKPTPFPYDKAWHNQIGNFDYVNIIADKIIRLIRLEESGIYNVGTEVKSMYELACQTKPDVDEGWKPREVPENVTMNVEKLNKALS